MKRRDILKYTALLTGVAVTSPLVLSLSSCKSDAALGNDYQPQFFSAEDFELIIKTVDTILPQTDSPSASQVGVHKMIDDMVANVYPSEAKKEYAEAAAVLTSHLKGLTAFDPDAMLGMEQSENPLLQKGYRNLKQQTVAYYLNTEEIGTKFLNYLPVPGEYNGCIELSEVGGKAWAI